MITVLMLVIVNVFFSQSTIYQLIGSDTLRLESKDHLYRYDVLLEDIRVSTKPPKIKEKLGSYQVKIKKGKPLKEVTIIETEEGIQFKGETGSFSIGLTHLPEGIKLKLHTVDFEQVSLPVLRREAEQFYGGGIQFSEYGATEREYLHLSQENGIGRGGGTISKWSKLLGVRGEAFATYCPVGYYQTSDKRWFHVLNDGLHQVAVENEKYVFTFFGEKNELVLGFRDLKTTQAVPYALPDWSLGTILGLQGGTKEVLHKLQAVLNKGGKVDAVWIQDWVGKRQTSIGSRLNWQWKLDTTVYSDFLGFKSYLNELDIKLLGYINPFFAEEGAYIDKGKEKGFFIKNKKGNARLFNYGGMKGYMLDIFNPDAYEWMKQIIKQNLVANGFDGWMADFAEWYPIDKEEIIETAQKHNQYPVLWNQLNYEVIKESKKELFFFNRSGGNKTSRYSSMMWLGDQMVDYTCEDGLCSVFDGYLSASDAGLPLVHSDVGGYTGVKKPIIKNLIRSKQVMLDWMILEAFTPTFRTHEGLLPDDFVQVYDSSLVDDFIYYSNLNRKLRPYFKALIKNRKQGLPTYKRIPQSIISEELYTKGFMVGEEIVILFESTAIEIEGFRPFISSDSKQKISVWIKKRSNVEELIIEG